MFCPPPAQPKMFISQLLCNPDENKKGHQWEKCSEKYGRAEQVEQSRPEVEVQKPRGLWGFEREMSSQGLMRLDLCPLLVALFRGAMESR